MFDKRKVKVDDDWDDFKVEDEDDNEINDGKSRKLVIFDIVSVKIMSIIVDFLNDYFLVDDGEIKIDLVDDSMEDD